MIPLQIIRMNHLFKIALFFFGFFPSVNLQAQVDLAFFKVYRPNGKLLQLEPGGSFAHVAIYAKRGWVHAHPRRGVEWISDFSKIGYPRYEVVILRHPHAKFSEARLRSFLGLPYDWEYDWATHQSIYCSELIGKLFRIRPVPMVFDPKIWGPDYAKKNGLPGLSPDRLYSLARQKGFQVISRPHR